MDYQVIRSNRRTMAAQIKGGQLIIRAPLRVSDHEIDSFVSRHRAWIETHLKKAQQEELCAAEKLTPEDIRRLTEQARAVIPERVAHYAPLVGVTYGRISIRHQRSRWGSCTGKGNLNFNCLLLLAPPEVLDSVVVHELCHRKEMNHSKRFYAEVLKVYPDYRKWNAWLKENGQILMQRGAVSFRGESPNCPKSEEGK